MEQCGGTSPRNKCEKSKIFIPVHKVLPLPMRFALGGVNSFSADHPCKKYTFCACRVAGCDAVAGLFRLVPLDWEE
eukprot:1189165-Prorocentrum_minimum.AAC.3